MSRWVPETDGQILRRAGKTAEEVAELSKILGRIVIQGYAGVDPESGKPNALALTEEVADVYAQLDETVKALALDVGFIEARRASKRAQMAEWEAMFTKPAAE